MSSFVLVKTLPKSPKGKIESSGDMVKVVAPSVVAPSYQDLVQLKEVRLKNKAYLVDNKSGFVYEMTKGDYGIFDNTEWKESALFQLL